MLKSSDWAKAIVERRATLMTSLECIFAVDDMSWAISGMDTVKDSEGVWQGGKRVFGGRKVGGEYKDEFR